MIKHRVINTVIEQSIKNVHPDLKPQLEEHLNQANWSSKEHCRKLATRFLGLSGKRFGRNSPLYWTSRGWSHAEAKVRAREFTKNQPKRNSPFGAKFWMSKVNPDTGTVYTSEEAQYKANSLRPIRKEYWMSRGLSEEDALVKAEQTKKSNSQKGAAASKEIDRETFRYFNHRCTEYWTSRGMTQEEAEKKVSQLQKTFSLKICQEKYGSVEGKKIWQERQDKWQHTLNQKPQEEKNRINRLKVGKGVSVSEAERELFERISCEVHDAQHQYQLVESDVKQFVYDIRKGKRLIEYNGDYWHMNPAIYESTEVHRRMNKTALEIWSRDQEKYNYAQSHGYEVMIVWEYDYKNNPDEVVQKCIQFLNK